MEHIDSVRPEWTFGDRIRKARRRAGLTVQEFAAALDITASALGQYETDRATPRDIVALSMRVQQQTGIPAAWMLGLDATEPPTTALPIVS